MRETHESLELILGAIAGLSPVFQCPLLDRLAKHKEIHKMTLTVLRDFVKTYNKTADADDSQRHYFEEDTFMPIEMMESLQDDKMRFMSIFGEKEIRIYESGVYRLDRGAKTERAIASKLERAYQPRYATDTLKVIDTEFRLASHEDVYHPDIINFKNGWIDIPSGKFHNHRNDDTFQSIAQLPFDYNPNPQCPNFDAFLADVQPEEQQRKLIFQAFACALFQGVPPLSMFIWMFVGETHTGKSTTLDILTALLGDTQVSNEKVQDLANGDNRFSRFQLTGKLANIDSDAKVDYLRGDGLLKQISAGDRVSIQGKGSNATEVRLTATLLIGINKLPQSADTTSGFLKRLMPIRFEEQHSGEDIDPDMVLKCTTKDELAGIFNHVFPFLQALVNREMRINRTEREEVEVEQFAEDNFNDPIGMFVEHHCESLKYKRLLIST